MKISEQVTAEKHKIIQTTLKAYLYVDDTVEACVDAVLLLV